MTITTATGANDEQPEKKALVASPQYQMAPHFISIAELISQRNKYNVFPEMQRDKAWGIRQCQGLIDTILLGEPIFPLEGYKEQIKAGDQVGQTFWRLIDGQQRITAVLEFADDHFPTWTARQKEHAEPNSLGPVEPGKKFSQLSPYARNLFLEYRFTINEIHNKSLKQLTTRFIRIQNHKPLSAAEKLNAYMSKAKDATKRIEQHPFWKDFYDGKTNRKQIFQSSLYLLALELVAPKVTVDLMGSKYVSSLIYGEYDKSINDELVTSVLTRLDEMSHVYLGANFTLRSVVVPMYQSIAYLKNAGYTIQSKDKGKLTPWIMNILSESRSRTSTPNYRTPMQMILYESGQRAFWDKQLKTVMGFMGVSIKTADPVVQLPMDNTQNRAS
jgi:Protein of unknown function DUF262